MIPKQLIDILKKDPKVVVLTGAGVSAESGIPTFRDALTGYWSKFDPQELATRRAYSANPAMVWQWYAERRQTALDCDPNPGHFALAELEKMLSNFLLVTQNVDGLHQRAGSKNVIDVHGNIDRFKCFDHNHPVDSWEETDKLPPLCPKCGSWVRPDIVWFEEMLNTEQIEKAWDASKQCHVFLSVGTSSVVYPAAALPEIALEDGAILVEINPNETPLTRYANFVISKPSGEALPTLIEAVTRNT